MVQFSDLRQLGKTKKRLDENEMEMGGFFKRASIFGRLKRRFSQSERDLSTLHLDMKENCPELNSTVDDSMLSCTMVKRKTNDSQSNGEISDEKSVHSLKHNKSRKPDYFNENNKSKSLTGEMINHKTKISSTETCNNWKNDNLVNRTRPRRGQLNHYVDCREIFLALKATEMESLQTNLDLTTDNKSALTNRPLSKLQDEIAAVNTEKRGSARIIDVGGDIERRKHHLGQSCADNAESSDISGKPADFADLIGCTIKNSDNPAVPAGSYKARPGSPTTDSETIGNITESISRGINEDLSSCINCEQEFQSSGLDLVDKAGNGLVTDIIDMEKAEQIARQSEDVRINKDINRDMTEKESKLVDSMENPSEETTSQVLVSAVNHDNSSEKMTAGFVKSAENLKYVEKTEESKKVGVKSLSDKKVVTILKQPEEIKSKFSILLENEKHSSAKINARKIKSAENLTTGEKFDLNDNIIHRKQKRDILLRRQSAPCLLENEPEEQARLEKMMKKSRSNSLKSALKRRSLSDSSGSSLRVRFDLTKNDSSGAIDEDVFESDDKKARDKLEAKSTTSAPKKKWNYVMRKFRIKQPLVDFTAYNERPEKPTTGDCSVREQQSKLTDRLSSLKPSSAQESSAPEQTQQTQSEHNERTEQGEVKDMPTANLKPTPPSCLAMRPGGEEDGAFTPLLHLAAADGDKELIKTLINIGVDLNEKDSKGWPAIHYAIAGGHFDCAGILLENGVDLNCYTSSVVLEYCKTVRTVLIKNDT